MAKERYIYAYLSKIGTMEVYNWEGIIKTLNLEKPHVITCVFDKPKGPPEEGKVYEIENQTVTFKGTISHAEAKEIIKNTLGDKKGEGAIAWDHGQWVLCDFNKEVALRQERTMSQPKRQGIVNI